MINDEVKKYRALLEKELKNLGAVSRVLDAAVLIIAGTARSMGVEVDLWVS